MQQHIEARMGTERLEPRCVNVCNRTFAIVLIVSSQEQLHAHADLQAPTFQSIQLLYSVLFLQLSRPQTFQLHSGRGLTF